MDEILKFHHFGILCEDIDKSKKPFIELNYHFSNSVLDIFQNVELSLGLHSHQPKIELVKPTQKNKSLCNFYQNNGSGIYHICYEVDFKKTSLKDIFPNINKKCLSEPKPAILFNNKKVSFFQVSGIGLIELLEK